MKLLILIVLLGMLAGCTEYRCVDGISYRRSEGLGPGDGLWHVTNPKIECVNLPEKPE